MNFSKNIFVFKNICLKKKYFLLQEIFVSSKSNYVIRIFVSSKIICVKNFQVCNWVPVPKCVSVPVITPTRSCVTALRQKCTPVQKQQVNTGL